MKNLVIALCLAIFCVSCGEKKHSSDQLVSNSAHSQIKISLENWPKQSSPFTRDAETELKIQLLLAKMTLEEKIGQIIQADIASVTPMQVKKYHLGSVLNGGNSAPGGKNRTGAKAWLELADKFWLASTDNTNGRTAIPLFWGTDAVHGHSNVVGATIFPHNIGLGAARDPTLIKRIGEVTAIEMLVTGLDWTFAPTIAVARNDRWGRTYESYSEDPEIVKAYAPKIIEGLQGKVSTDNYLDDEHLLATVKHFVGDGGTENGTDQGENISTEAQLRDIHAAGYPGAIKAGAQVVMASFNSWHGKKMHGYRSLLTDVLVDRMGLDGFVVGDWNGHGQVVDCTPEDCAQSFNAGLDLFMAPDSWKKLYENTLTQVNNGVISIERLNQAVARIIRVKFRMGLFAASKPSERKYAGRYELLGSKEHRAVAREAVRKSLVLLKNNHSLLPLSPKLNLLVAGDTANNIGKQSGGWTLSWQGTGNSNKDFPNGDSIYEGIEKAVIAAGGTVQLQISGQFEIKPDVAIVIFGEQPYAEFEGDRSNLDFSDDRALDILKKLKQQNVPTVAVFISGRPLWVNPELNQSDAFVAAWLPGSEGAGIADVIFSDKSDPTTYDFSGKLSFSWPKNASGHKLNIGDKSYDPLFAYGYGLRYSDQVNIRNLSENSGIQNIETTNVSSYLFNGAPEEPFLIELIDGRKKTDIDDSDIYSINNALTISSSDYLKQEDA
ncbi:MAG: glycoside hydrolase family 3 protein, partial [Kangiellaceae bacterium]|nr:glycoside hydrolase family 3 protein [Kangiellaceae bacterium]